MDLILKDELNYPPTQYIDEDSVWQSNLPLEIQNYRKCFAYEHFPGICNLKSIHNLKQEYEKYKFSMLFTRLTFVGSCVIIVNLFPIQVTHTAKRSAIMGGEVSLNQFNERF